MFHDPDLIDPAHRAFFHSAVRAEAFEVMFADKKFRRLSHRFHIQLLPAAIDIFSFEYVFLIPGLHIISICL